MAKIEKATRLTKPCAEVLPKPTTAASSRTWAWRVEKARRAKRDPCQCATRSSWVIDGKPLCLNHAGQEALRILAST